MIKLGLHMSWRCPSYGYVQDTKDHVVLTFDHYQRVRCGIERPWWTQVLYFSDELLFTELVQGALLLC